LLVALARNNTEAALALLEGGALTTAVDRAGNSALHIAAQKGNLTMVNALLARRMNPNILTPITPSPGAAGGTGRSGGGARGGSGGNRASSPGEQTPLMLAAKADHEDVMRALVAAGADPTRRAEDGSNLLMAAAAGARLKTFKYAFELDPHVDVVTTPSKGTIMHAAVAQNGRTQPEVCEVIQFLADHGAALDELDEAGRTPIVAADTLPVDQAVDLLTKLITSRGGRPKIPSKR
jgi:ankyrin repeat protein